MRTFLLKIALCFIISTLASCQDEIPDDNLPQTPKTQTSALQAKDEAYKQYKSVVFHKRKKEFSIIMNPSLNQQS